MKLSIARIPLLGLSLLFACLVVSSSYIFAQDPPATNTQIQRWVQFREVRGTVTYLGQQARVGDRLSVGDRISTSNNSSAILAVDDGIATVRLSENTNIQIAKLDTLPNTARITRIFTAAGLVRVEVRHFKNPDSRFEIAFRGEEEDKDGGVAGSRGTAYGVAVGPNGKTGVSTFNGDVEVASQNQSVLVSAGTSSLVIPGEGPTRPGRTTGDVKFRLRLLSVTPDRLVRVNAEVNPLNLVYLNGQAVEVERNGKFDITVSQPANRVLKLVVRTPLGEEQVYELEVSDNVQTK